MKQGPGLVCCFSLKNPGHPEYSFSTETGVMCLDFHPQHASLLAVGCYDGAVMIFDVRNRLNRPIFQSTVKTGKHTDPVWQVPRRGPPRALFRARTCPATFWGVPSGRCQRWPGEVPPAILPAPSLSCSPASAGRGRCAGRRRTWPRTSTSSPSPPTAASPSGP